MPVVRAPFQTILSEKSKIYSPRRGYFIILEIAATLLFIGVTIFLLILGLILLKLKHASNRPLYFREPFLLSALLKKSFRITFQAQVCKLENSSHNLILKFTKAENITKSFSSEKFIETNNIFAFGGKKPLLFQLRACKQRHNPTITTHMQFN